MGGGLLEGTVGQTCLTVPDLYADGAAHGLECIRTNEMAALGERLVIAKAVAGKCMMRILVTGFEPYGGRKVNSSLEVMRALDGRTIAGATVVGRSLPVALAPLSGRVGHLLEEIRPDFVVSLGLCPGESAIRLERLGVNLADFPIADNEGRRVRNMPLIEGGAASHFSTLPLAEILDGLLVAGIPARMSMTAGTYLCNACLYHFRAAVEREGRAIPSGFIHLPDLPEQVAASLNASNEETTLASMDLSRMIRAVEIAIAITVGR